MTVVLQHQFWDLVVTDEQFEVGLSFGGVPERVVVPFASIKSFVDPSVQFGVQFEMLVAGEDAEAEKVTDETGKRARPPAEHRASSDVATVPTPANPQVGDAPTVKKPAATKSGADSKAKEVAEQTPQGAADAPTSGAQVVSLDRFRKK
jgi:hypothetical protein